MTAPSSHLDTIALTSAAPGRRENGVALVVVVLSLVTLLVMTPFAAVPLVKIDAFQRWK